MKLYPTSLGSLVVLAGLGQAQFIWPSSIDELEDVMFLNTGHNNRGFAAHITPCSFSEFGPGRQTAAEWLRIGFHDMATTNVYFAPHGGIDASIAFELNTGENIGAGFNTTLTTYAGVFNSRLSVSDLIALGVYSSVRGCGGPIVPMRGGRIDATAAGPMGVPQPQNGQGVFISQFERMGLNTTQMIQMTACGHTLGGVHAGDFSNIVVPGTVPNDYQLFDNTFQFDNAVAARYISGPDTDPLVVGISVSSGRNSDFAVFTADNNVTLQAMTNVDTFNSMCSSALQQMIEVVDPSIVTLSNIIVPYEVKPSGLQLKLLTGGTLITFSGEIRVRTTSRTVSGVQILYTDRNGASGGSISTTLSGTANGFDDSFSFYAFSVNIPSATSISSFTVVVTTVGGSSQTFNNNGAGFPIQDSVFVQTAQSCLSNGNLTILAAIRSSISTPVNMILTQKIARPKGIPVPALTNSTLLMVKGITIGPYIIYSGSIPVNNAVGAKYGVFSGSFADTFKDPNTLGATCSTLGTSAPNSTFSSVLSTTSSTTASASPTPTHKQIMGAYSFQGCYTEGTGVRALTGAIFYNYTAMTTEMCLSNCAGYNYWGIEYGGECYCGNTLAATSTLASLSDCNFICPGNSYEYCGAGNRLEMYELSTMDSTRVNISLSSSSLTSPTSTPTLHTVPSAGGYTYLGCYTEGNGVRALSAAFYPNDAQTIELCVAACSPYKYAGAEYGRECWCGDSFGVGANLTTESDCDMTCAGDQYEYCGAGNRLSVYVKNGTGSVASMSSNGLGSGSTSRTKSSTAVFSSKSTPTSIISTATIKSASTTSSNSLDPKSKSTSSSATSKSSTVSSTSTMSNSSIGIIVSAHSTSTTSPSSPSRELMQTAPAIKPTVGNYTYYGCRTEGTNIRALTGSVAYNYTAMTLEMCSATCNGWRYWGVEYGGECYCGNTWNTGSVNATNSECSFACPGNSSEFCGAGNMLSAYYLTT